MPSTQVKMHDAWHDEEREAARDLLEGRHDDYVEEGNYHVEEFSFK